MGFQLSGQLAKAAAFCGVVWPTVDEDALTAAGSQWSAFGGQGSSLVNDVASAVAHVTTNNSGPATASFALQAEATNNATACMQDFVASGPPVAAGFVRAARVITTTKMAAAASLSVLAALMASTAEGPTISGGGEEAAAAAEEQAAEAEAALQACREETRLRVEAIWEQGAAALRAGG